MEVVQQGMDMHMLPLMALLLQAPCNERLHRHR